jgi:rhodanese-related sulfurtransferase
MNIWKRVRSLVSGKESVLPVRQAPKFSPTQDDEPEIVVPEISVEELQAALGAAEAPLVIDVREPYEWRLVRMTAARHIPMSDVPAQLDSLPRDRAVVVMCAHGSRSYSVAAWLIEQGIHASSLAGGITQWASRGGEVEQG